MRGISVDKVGRFFRDPKYVGVSYGSVTDAIRVVFDLVLEEGARKCITVSLPGCFLVTLWGLKPLSELR